MSSLFEKYVNINKKRIEVEDLLNKKNSTKLRKNKNSFLIKIIPVFFSFLLFIGLFYFCVYEVLSGFDLGNIFNIPNYSNYEIKNLYDVFNILKESNISPLLFTVPIVFLFSAFSLIMGVLHRISEKELKTLKFKNIMKDYINENDNILEFFILFIFSISLLIDIYYFFAVSIIAGLRVIVALIDIATDFIENHKYIKEYDNDTIKKLDIQKAKKEYEYCLSTSKILKSKILNNSNEMKTVAIESTKEKDGNFFTNFKIDLADQIVSDFEKINKEDDRLDNINRKINKVFNETRIINE